MQIIGGWLPFIGFKIFPVDVRGEILSCDERDQWPGKVISALSIEWLHRGCVFYQQIPYNELKDAPKGFAEAYFHPDGGYSKWQN